MYLTMPATASSVRHTQRVLHADLTAHHYPPPTRRHRPHSDRRPGHHRVDRRGTRAR